MNVKSVEKEKGSAKVVVEIGKDEFETALGKAYAKAKKNIMASQDPGFVADFIGQNTSISYSDKQKLLEQQHPVRRLEQAVQMLARELDILRLESEISEKVQENVNKGQRDYYLREQLHDCG